MASITPWYDYPIIKGYNPTGHTGTDIGTPTGTPLTALWGGTIENASHQAWGWQVVEDVPNGLGSFVRVVLAHLDSVAVAAGQTVQPGQFLGLSGGENLPAQYSNGPHTHVGIYTGPVWQNQTPSGQIETINPTPVFQVLQGQQPNTAVGATNGAPQGANSGGSGTVGTPLSFDPCAWLPAGVLQNACYATTEPNGPSIGQPGGPNPVGNGLAAVNQFFSTLLSSSLWLKVLGVVIGLVILAVALSAVLRGNDDGGGGGGRSLNVVLA